MDIPACNAGTAPLLSPRRAAGLRPGGGTFMYLVRSFFSCLSLTLLLCVARSFFARKHFRSLVSTWWIFVCVQSFCLKGICAGCFHLPPPPLFTFFRRME